MKKAITALTRRLINKLNKFVYWLEEQNIAADVKSNFVDLAPTDEADKSGVYSEALMFATNNEKVTNIALTGPYGSGKSSIILSFLKRYRRPALRISLAAFVPEASYGEDKKNKQSDSNIKGNVSRQEIERSILQQLLYGADSNRLPLSRFKRIQTPGIWSIPKSIFITLGVLSVWHIFFHHEDISSGAFFEPIELSNWLNLTSFFIAIIFFFGAVHKFYVASFGLSLKSVSLRDIEIKPAFDDQASILNRHLDEIIYFFQSTKYDLVIIEDLDRFKDSEIFVTLREINNLVNENSGVKRTIRFLYALRDDIFINTDRTKFFEFIVPVIPIINTSNSIDMVLAQGSRIELDEGLNKQFLREVSRYLNDLRLIQNIFNEYVIYSAKIDADKEKYLDPNKLLAILIYKNVYPRDFEQLHRGSGNLTTILNLKEFFIAGGESRYRAEIETLEKELEVAERQTPLDLNELRKIYAMALIEKLPSATRSVSIDHQGWIAFPKLVDQDNFEELITCKNLYYIDINGHINQITNLNLEKEIDPQKSYQKRKSEIEKKDTENRNIILHKINDLRSKISQLRTIKLNELLRLNANSVKEYFKDFGENSELARFLILEGYLDDTYYQYTSLFHSGRLSPNDNKFLIQIRAFVTPEPDFQIDNPKEVIAAMRDEDFRQSYVLNVMIVDCMLNDSISYHDQIKKMFEHISIKFSDSEKFFDTFYNNGSNISRLLSGLINTWEDFIPEAITSPKNILHITQIILNTPKNKLEELAKKFRGFPEFVSENLPDILINSPELEPECLVCLNFEVKDLASVKDHPEIVRTMFERGLFELTMENIEYIYQAILGENNLRPLYEKNYTAIRSTDNKILIDRVEREFDHYLHDILLSLPENSKEDVPSILAVINREDINLDSIEKFLDQQTTLLPILEDLPYSLYPVLFRLGKIEPTWVNCNNYMKSEVFDEGSLIDYLDREYIREAILKNPIPSDPESVDLRYFLVSADSMSDVNYKDYVNALPKFFKKFPAELNATKRKILIEEKKIEFNKENIEAVSEDRELQVFFVTTNINKYLSHPENFELNDDFLEDILQSIIDNSVKLEVIKIMDLNALTNRPERAALIGSILADNTKISLPGANVVQSMIEASKQLTVKITLFNKYQEILSNSEVRRILSILPDPFCKITIGHHKPKLKNTAENRDLVKWLCDRKIISSYKNGLFSGDDIKVNLYRN
ncbi:ATP-binding protein [Saccharospirillum sp. HFRX-1]|uniref:YobI family P-loop NTPase n=1 Tax=unclassified Saccharospirillum TaxID=2633430 RepID=UPI00371EF73D